MKGNEQLKEYGKRLRLYHLCNHMDELLHVAQQDKPTYHEFLMGLLEREITCREKRITREDSPPHVCRKDMILICTTSTSRKESHSTS